MLLRKLLKARVAETEHDFLSKCAYVAVRAARATSEDAVAERAITRLKARFPDTNRDDIEEMVYAMTYNMGVERGGA